MACQSLSYDRRIWWR